ncbi:TRAP transporter substrate-binding protein DctP [Myxococcota bacterium]|nr:TRAP transporter substrate-binding protein DctP [Myxococcota bacterium]
MSQDSPLAGRRAFLRSTLLGAAAVGAAAPGLLGQAGCDGPQPRPLAPGAPGVSAGRQVLWRLASSFPRSLDTIFGAAEVLSERVAAMTGGAFQIRVYPAGELVPALQVLDAVQQGTVQIGQSAGYYYIGKNPALAFDTCVPFGMTARQQGAWLWEGGGLELVDAMYADFGVRCLPAGNTGVQMGGWFKRAVPDLQSLQGLKMRIPGIGGRVMAELGVSVQNIAGGDIFPALETGAIDATEWVGPYDDEKLGFYKAANLYYQPGWWEPGPNLSIFVGERAWASLPAEYQQILRTAAFQAGVAMQTRYDQKNPEAFERLLAAGVQVQTFADEILARAREVAFQMYADAAAADPAYRRVYEPWEQARRRHAAWWGQAELAYQRFAFGG